MITRSYLRCKFLKEQLKSIRQSSGNTDANKKGKSKPVWETIASFPSMRDAVLEELSNHEQVVGVKWKRFPGLTKLLKGHRKGELTVLTGSTGSGKTTFLSEYSLDLCLQGVKTLWGNFEMKNVRLVKLLLTQLAQKSLLNNLGEFDAYAEQFAQLPMYFMTFHGEEYFEQVLETMQYAVNQFSVEHIIIDNLQFMVGNRFSKLDRFEYQDGIIGSCRKFATKHNCHVTLVIHPRKEQSEELNNNSIFGGGKATQEADNIMIVQVKWSANFRVQKYLQVTKNRFDGDLGITPLFFNKETHCFGTKA